MFAGSNNSFQHNQMINKSIMSLVPKPATPTANMPQSFSGSVASPGGEWSKVDSLNSYIVEAANKFGLDPNLIKAVMKLESDGEWIISHAGAVGYMQVMPEYWGHLGYNLNDKRENIIAGAHVLDYFIDQSGGDIRKGLERYHGIGFDGFTTHTQYADVILKNYQTLQGSSQTTVSGGATSFGASGWNTIFGGQQYRVTQEMGLNSFSQQHLSGMYAYGPSYGVTGHPGIDVGTPRGTTLRAPADGVVIVAGGSGYYCDTSGCGPGRGELKIKLNNGDEIILGHMAGINVSVGQRVTAGQMVGISGTLNGDHVHVEYRTPDPSTSSGWRAIDPRSGAGGGSGFSLPTMETPAQRAARYTPYMSPLQRASYNPLIMANPFR
jgi:murein DD-endopeptidase MepM/ murein hydrolase activator NlpD